MDGANIVHQTPHVHGQTLMWYYSTDEGFYQLFLSAVGILHLQNPYRDIVSFSLVNLFLDGLPQQEVVRRG